MTGAMYSAVAGLRSHMSKLNVIGNNIANVNTFSYKTTRMTFEESISMTVRAGSNSAGTTTGGVNPTQYGYGSNISSIDVNMATSTYSPTGYAMDCMISGDGFFLTGDKLGDFGTVSDISSLALSRMGDFGLSDDGYVRDSRGEIVYGFAYVQNPEYDPNASEEQILKNPLLAEKEILSTDLVPLRLPLAAATPTIANGGIVVEVVTFNEGEADEYTEDVEFYRWEEGEAVYDVLSYPDTNNGNAMYNSSILPTYDAELEADQAGLEADDPADTNGMTYSYVDDTYPKGENTTRIVANNDDFPVQLTSISIDKNGMISGTNSETGDPVVVGYIAIATVDNSAGVTNTGSCYYSAMGGAGNIRVSVLGGVADGMYFANKTPTWYNEDGTLAVKDENGNYPDDAYSEMTGINTLDSIGAGGNTSVVSGGLEASNVDLAVEFSEMITTQRGYQANTRVVTVTDSMLEELVNLKR